ncbi:MAG: hypothetical protein OES09_15310, partial [Gammaproteobacteria bacterium]|nr:hypothetical protein [Gammaproteobacteria bacterium]
MSLKDYDTAIDQFQRSYDFFSKHYWLDKYRGVTMMSPSIWSYREMALMNIASVHVANFVVGVAFGRDGKSVVSASFSDPTLMIWDITTGQPMRMVRGN